MYRGYLHGQQLLCLEQVVQVGLRVYAVNIAAVGVNGREVLFPLLVAHVHRPFIGEEQGVTAVSGRHHAVKHVDAAFNGFKDVLWRADTHQITGTVLRQYLVHHLNHVVHHLCGLADSQSADAGAAAVVQLAQRVYHMLGCILTQILVGQDSLHNSST